MDDLGTLLEAAAFPDQPGPLFAALAEHCRARFGYVFMTVLRHDPAAGEIERVFSTEPNFFPVGGRKPMGPTPWGAITLGGGRPWLGDGPDDIRWAFPDADNILSLSECCACGVARFDGKSLGILSLNGPSGCYGADDLAAIDRVAQTLLPVLLTSKTQRLP